MSKKRKAEPVEILGPEKRPVADFKRMIAEAVEKQVSEILSGSGVDLEPWFRPRNVADEIKRRQTVTEQRKWTYYFEDWGCLVCGAKDAGHMGHGLCTSCFPRTVSRLRRSMDKRRKSAGEDRRFDDELQKAREALAQELPALPERKRGRSDETH